MAEESELTTPQPPQWLYFSGMPTRSGTSVYLHLVRSPHDGARESRAARQARLGHAEAAVAWKALQRGRVEDWMEAILTLMLDGEPRSFNAIVLALTNNEMTADTAFHKDPDKALWRLVDARQLWWACEDGVVYFLHEKFIKKESADEEL